MRIYLIAIIGLIYCNSFAQVRPTSSTDRLKSMQQRKGLQQQSVINHIAFRNIGPSIMSGRVVDLEVNPADPTEFYVAYATGGLWRTINNGQSFMSIFDSEDVLGIGDIAIDWKPDNSRRTIWIGTGEVNSSRSSYAGIGMYKSDNNGKTWAYKGLPESHHIGKIQLHPTNPNTVWVAVLGHLYSPNKERGVYKTTDGGNTWKQTLYIDENTGVVDLDINPNNPDELYSAVWYRTRRAWDFVESGKTSGIYKSTDGGEKWNLVSGISSGFVTGNGVGRIGIAVYPKNPNVVYAIVDNQDHKPDTASKAGDTTYLLKDFKEISKQQFLALDNRKLDTFFKKNNIPRKYSAKSVKELVENGKLKSSAIWDYLYDANTALFETPVIGAEVFKSTDAGISWKKVNTEELKLYNTYGYYFGKIYVSPVNENKLIITGYTIDMSTDGGKTFKSIGKENVHADHHAAWFNPSRDNHIMSGNDGGMNISYDDGKHWFKANTPAVGQFYAITVDNAKPYNVYGGLQDNGTWYGSSKNKEDYNWYDDGDYPFKSINGGDGMQVQVDTRDNKTVYSGFQFGFYSRTNLATKERKFIKPVNDLGQPSYRFNWQSPILLSKHNQDVLYFGTNFFHRSLNKADTLPPLSSDLTTNPAQGDVPFGTITTISESPLRFGLLYAGTDDGNIQMSNDGGYTWTPCNNKLPKDLYVSRVVASAFNEGRVYAALNGYRNDHFLPYLYVSNDYGKTWNSIAANLPNEPINVMREDPKNENILYVGTDGGVYVSLNAGSSFMGWNNGLPKSVPVHDIAIHTRENEIVLGTHGRSIYIAKLDSVQLVLKDSSYRAALNSKVDQWQAAVQPQNKKKQKGKQNEGIDISHPPALAKE